jgi:hypothetical protein
MAAFYRPSRIAPQPGAGIGQFLDSAAPRFDLFSLSREISTLQWLFLYRYHGVGNAPLVSREPRQPASLEFK